jgi:hypothetical protein
LSSVTSSPNRATRSAPTSSRAKLFAEASLGASFLPARPHLPGHMRDVLCVCGSAGHVSTPSGARWYDLLVPPGARCPAERSLCRARAKSAAQVTEAPASGRAITAYRLPSRSARWKTGLAADLTDMLAATEARQDVAHPADEGSIRHVDAVDSIH